MIVGFSQDDYKRGSHRVGEHFHGGLYSSIVIKWLFDRVEVDCLMLKEVFICQ